MSQEKFGEFTVSGNMAKYSLAAISLISLNLYDLRGRLLQSLARKSQGPGSYKVPLPEKLTNGTYILRFKTDCPGMDKTTILIKAVR
jgi:hypothetical protein